MPRKLILKFAVFVIVMLGWAPAASASLITWNLQNATFYDGGVATGFFTFDTVSSSIPDWSIGVSGGDTNLFPALTYTPLNSTTTVGTGDLGFPLTLFEFSLNDNTRLLSLLLENSLPPGGGTDAFHIWPDGEPGHYGGFECLTCSPFRNFATGSVVGNEPNIPEPGSVVLVGLGLVAFALRRRN